MRKKLIIFIIILSALFVLYWLKCSLDLNVSKQVSLSHYFPFKYLQGDKHKILVVNKPGVILKDGFESSFFSYLKWAGLWSREKGEVAREYVKEGVNGSGCLLIKSTSAKDWAYAHNKKVKVKVGDEFSFSARIRNKGNNLKTSVGVTLYDKDLKAIKWGYAGINVINADSWKTITQAFIVPEGAKYLRFEITGSGIGQTWVDDVEFRKI